MLKITNHRELILLTVTLLFCTRQAFPQLPDVAWEKQLPDAPSHYFSDVTELEDESFVVLGAIQMPVDREFDTWLLKCNKSGDTLKTRIFNKPGNDIPLKIIPNPPNGFLIASITIFPGGKPKTRLMAVDASFSQKWITDSEKTTAVSQTDVAVDNDGNIWWINTLEDDNGESQALLRKIDAEGKTTGEFVIDKGNQSSAYAIRVLPDGMLAVASQVQVTDGNPTIQVTKMDTNGKVQWKSLTPPSGKVLTPQCLCCSPDNTLLVGGWAGMCWNPDALVNEQIWDYDYWLSKIDANGKIIWSQQYNRQGSEKGTAIAVLPSGNIMAAGKCETSFTGTIGPWLLLVDKNGKLLKEQVYKFKFTKDQATRIICTSDGGFLMVGPGYIENRNQLSGWVKRLNPVL